MLLYAVSDRNLASQGFCYPRISIFFGTHALVLPFFFFHVLYFFGGFSKGLGGGGGGRGVASHPIHPFLGPPLKKTIVMYTRNQPIRVETCVLGNKLMNIQFAKYHIWNNKSEGFPSMVLSIETFNQSVCTQYSEAVNARYTFQPLWVSGFTKYDLKYLG